MDHGFEFPADWEEHRSVWLAWPPEECTVCDEQNVRDAHCRVICALLDHGVPVELLVNSKGEEDDVRGRVKKAGSDCHQSILSIRVIHHTDMWMRDFGPIFVNDRRKKEQVVLSFKWTNWGYVDHYLREPDLSVCS